MLQTHASVRSQRSSHNPYRDYGDKLPSTNPFLDRETLEEEPRTSDDQSDQSQLSPMFIDYLRAKTGAPVDLERINTDTKTANQYRRYTISPVDGKTEGCNRTHTFEAILDQSKISSDAGREKKVGHGWQVARAFKRVMSTKGRGSRKSDAPPVRLAA